MIRSPNPVGGTDGHLATHQRPNSWGGRVTIGRAGGFPLRFRSTATEDRRRHAARPRRRFDCGITLPFGCLSGIHLRYAPILRGEWVRSPRSLSGCKHPADRGSLIRSGGNGWWACLCAPCGEMFFEVTYSRRSASPAHLDYSKPMFHLLESMLTRIFSSIENEVQVF